MTIAPNQPHCEAARYNRLLEELLRVHGDVYEEILAGRYSGG